jgi:hypothetical protein
MTRVIDNFYMVLSAVAFAACCYMLISASGCSARSILNNTPPAQQQNKTTSPNAPTIHIPDIPVELVDVDQDGTITAQERQSLMGDQPSVIGTFATIIGLVLLASIGSAWASAKWKPEEPPPAPPEDAASDGGRSMLTEDMMGVYPTNPTERRREPAAPDPQENKF